MGYEDEHFFPKSDGPRKAAVASLVIGVPYVLLSIFVITPLALVLLALIGLVDLVFALLLNRNVGEKTGTLAWRYHRQVGILYTWNLGNLRWALYGGSIGFQILPYSIWRPGS